MQKSTKILAAICAVGILVAIAVCIQSALHMKEIEDAAPPTPMPIPETPATSTPAAEVTVTVPGAGSIVTSPVRVEGTAPGTWFFEATAGLRVLNSDKKVITQSYVSTSDQWMTADRVTFAGTTTFPAALRGQGGYIEIAKDNPSGLPENDKSVLIPVLFR